MENPKNVEDLQQWLTSVTPESLKKKILVDTGTMKFNVVGFEVQHGGLEDLK
jgi:hypothetical protein